MGQRNPVTIFSPSPSDPIDILQDGPRLQSMAEAYDLLRGSGVSGADDAAVRARIDNWAQAIHDDVNLTGVLGIAGHRDNWGIKGGSALITTALALSAHAHASGWMAFGNTLVHDSFAVTGSSAGWYRESAHYLNYALDNCFSTATHVLRRTGVDWFAMLEPFAQAALDLRQPDGSEAAFEEGVPAVFPFDVFAPRYPELGGQLAWAWNHSTKNTDSWANQQLAHATQFLAGELPAEAPPAGRPSRFVERDAHISALRSGFDAQAVQVTLFAARDHSASTLVSSRHNLQNPLDLTIAGFGQMLLPTSGGGPTVTTSANRSYYLTPASKNLPLVNNTAPFVTDGAQLAVDSRLAGQDEGGHAGRLLELVRTRVTGAWAAPVSSVSRTVALLGGGLVVLLDEVTAASSVPVSLALHGRGTRTTPAGSLLQTSWALPATALDVFAIGAQPLTLAPVAGSTTIGWDVEEAIDGIELRATGSRVRALTLLSPRAAATAPVSVQDRSPSGSGGVLALRVTGGPTIDHLSAAPAGTLTSVDGLATDASFAVLRETGGVLQGFGGAQVATLSWGGTQLLQSDHPLTISVSLDATGLLAELSPDQQGASTFTLGGAPAFEPGLAVRAFFGGQPLPLAQLHAGAGGVGFTNLTGGGTLRVEQGARVLAPLAPQTISEGSQLAFTLDVTPPAGETLAFSMTSSEPTPGSAPQLDPVTGAFTWTPGFQVASRAGPRDLVFTFVAQGNGFAASVPCEVRVLDVNQPPAVQAPPDQTVRRGRTLHLQLAGADPDGDALTWSFAATPALAAPGPTLGASTGAFDWAVPLDAVLGTFVLDFSASDGLLGATGRTELTVVAENHAPRFTTMNQQVLVDPTAALAEARAGVELVVELGAVDDDGDGIALSATQLPAGATWTDLASGVAGSAQGRLAWTPGAAGDATAILRATDPQGGESELTLTIRTSAGAAVARGCGGCSGGAAPGLEALALGLLWVLHRRGRRVATSPRRHG